MRIKSKSIQDKKCICPKIGRTRVATLYDKCPISHKVEQSNPNSPEKCGCHCHSEQYKKAPDYARIKPIGCDHCQPKTEDTGVYPAHDKLYVAKEEETQHIEDTGECKCHCHHNNINAMHTTEYCDAPYYYCKHCKASGVSKDRDKMSPPFTPEVKTQQGWEIAFDKDDIFQFGVYSTDQELTQENITDRVKQFISQEIESSKRELIEEIKLGLKDKLECNADCVTIVKFLGELK